MSKDDGFARITLRIPNDLHQRLGEAAAKKRSVNAEIIARLESTFPRYISDPALLPERFETLEDIIKRELDEFEERLRRLRHLADQIEDPSYQAAPFSED